MESAVLPECLARASSTGESISQSMQTINDLVLDTRVTSVGLLDAFEDATERYGLCPNRLWAVAKMDLPNLMPKGISMPRLQSHDLCTFDFCELSQRDFTTVKQRHECQDGECVTLQGLFPRNRLTDAITAEESTVWRLGGKSMIEPSQPYMAISHVWSDGTGTGAWEDGEINKCLYEFFERIAKQFQCEGIWWDTLCIPREKAVRNKAIPKIQKNYQDARITLVHDCFLRESEWINAEAACFAILMSPWFSRGWTALELANSPKVKVVFKGPCGPLIKDLDEQILAKNLDDQNPVETLDGQIPTKDPTKLIPEATSGPHQRATNIIRSLRRGIKSVDDLLTALGPRHTSWAKDLAIISGLLVGVEIAPKDGKGDTWQQYIYKSILRRIGKVAPGHLFHNAATMSEVSWCPTSLFQMPKADSDASLRITADLDLVGKWKLIPAQGVSEKCIWNGIHPLIREKLKHQLELPDKCVLLAEPGALSADRALLVKAMEKRETSEFCCQYVGALYFYPGSLEKYFSRGNKDEIELQVRVLGDAKGKIESAGKAWETIENLWRSRTGRGGCDTDSEAERTKVEEDHTPHNSEAASKGETKTAMKLRQTRDHDTERSVPNGTNLCNAIWRGHRAIFHKLMEEGADPNVLSSFGRRPLHLAAERGDEEMVRSLLMAGANLNALCDHGQTPLHRAAWGCSEAVVKQLLEIGIDANIKDNDGNIALHIAAKEGFESAVGLLLSRGADVDARGLNHLTPLHYAAMNGHEGVTNLLLENDADVESKDNKFGWMPLHCAADSGNKAVVQMLLRKKANIHVEDDKRRWTPLNFAAMGGHKDVIELLAGTGANVNARDKKRWTPLQFARAKGHKNVFGLLMGQHAKADAEMDLASWTTLHFLAVNEQGSVTKLLIENHTQTEIRENGRGWQPLHIAAENGLELVTAQLVKRGANVNVKTKIEDEGQTPLHLAAEHGHEAVAGLLIKNGADVNLRECFTGPRWGSRHSGSTPLHLAIDQGHEAVVRLLVENGADINIRHDVDDDSPTPLLNAIHKSHDAIVKLLVEKGANVNLKGRRSLVETWQIGITPLQAALEHRNEMVAKLLIENGADISWHDDETSLHFAMKRGLEGTCRLLIENGAGINARDRRKGQTPLHCAVLAEREAMVQLLVEKGANVKAKDKTGSTPAQYAKTDGIRKLLGEAEGGVL